MTDRLTSTYSNSAYHPLSCEFDSRSWRGIFYILCNELASDHMFSPVTSISSTTKTDPTTLPELFNHNGFNNLCPGKKLIKPTF